MHSCFRKCQKLADGFLFPNIDLLKVDCLLFSINGDMFAYNSDNHRIVGIFFLLVLLVDHTLVTMLSFQ